MQKDSISPPPQIQADIPQETVSDGTVRNSQLALDIGIEVERSVNGVEMGVLQNGVPYLTQRGLATAAGVGRATIFDISKEWEQRYENIFSPNSRLAHFVDFFQAAGYDEEQLYIEVTKDGASHYAYPDVVCQAVFEYFAFKAQTPNEIALKNHRDFSAIGVRQYIYKSLNYSGEDGWKYYLDRVSLLNNSAPEGHFIVFHEIDGLAVDLIAAGLRVNEHTIPDISVGRLWSDHWGNNSLNEKYGERIRWDHNYPDYYPQASSNPQPSWAYPDSALPEFRRWLNQEYLITKFPRYILNKANVLRGGKAEASKIANLYAPKSIESSGT